MNIVVIGSGYVGTTAAAIFALSGYSVTAVDVDQKKVDIINSGKAPFFEVGLDNLVAEGLDRGTLVASTDYSSVSEADFVFSCVGTPDNPDGSSNLEYVFAAAKTAAPLLKEGAVYIQKSTVPVGTGRRVTEVLPEYCSYVSNPEFLRESTSIYDTVFFDRVVAGGMNEEANQSVLSLHKNVEEHAEEIAEVSGIEYSKEKLRGHSGEYISTKLESAELIKVTANAFLALKISFANSIAQLSDKVGADITEVVDAVGADARIGRSFLNAGRGYGGGCFPKDVSGLIASGLEHGVDLEIMQAATQVNQAMPGYIIEKMNSQLEGLHGKRIAVLGLAFKSGTSDTRKSPGIAIANILVEQGAEVYGFDPEGMEEAKQSLSGQVHLTETPEESVKDADAVIVATNWPEFLDITPQEYAELLKGTVFVDAMNCFNPVDISSASMMYIGVGRK